jgi:hypothetical protein
LSEDVEHLDGRTKIAKKRSQKIQGFEDDSPTFESVEGEEPPKNYGTMQTKGIRIVKVDLEQDDE